MQFKLSRLSYLICLSSFLATLGIAGTKEQSRSNSTIFQAGQSTPTKSFSSFGRKLKKKSKVNVEARNNWLARTRYRLKHIQVSDGMKAAKVKSYQSGLVQYWIEDEALLSFEGGEWLYVVTHSGHLSDGVGSAILAVDNAGNLYANQAHVCREIFIDTRKSKEFLKLSDFLKQGVEKNSWEKLVP